MANHAVQPTAGRKPTVVESRRVATSSFAELARDLGFVYLVPVVPFALAFTLGGTHLTPRLALTLLALGITYAFYAHRFGRAFTSFFNRGR